MSNDSPQPPAAIPEPAPERIHRGRIGLNVGIQIVLCVAIFGMVNVIGHRRFKQWDYTYSRTFSLADTTVKFISQVGEPVRVTVLAARESPIERDASPLLDQYQRYMKGKLEVEFIDTKRDVAAWDDFRIRLKKSGANLPQEVDGLLVQSVQPREQGSADETYFHKWIPAESLYVMDREKKVPVAFRGESLLNTAIAAVTQPDRPRVALVAGMGQVRQTPAGTFGHVFSEICSAQNIEVEPWLMMQDPEYTSRYKGLVFVSTTLFGAAQDEVLTRFYETPGNSVMILLNPEFDCPDLNKWMARYGIQPQNDRVLLTHTTASGTNKQFTVDAQFQAESPITRGIENTATLFPGFTRSLKLLTNLQKQRDEAIRITPIVAPSPDFWGETKYEDVRPFFDAKEDNGKPLTIAASVERGAAADPRVQMQSSRMVVVGNADLAMPPPFAQNYDFLTRSLNWMLHRDETAANDSSTDKAKHRFSVAIKPEQRQRVLIITTIVMPLAALMTGLVIWSARRH